jgi:hypothetical protein
MSRMTANRHLRARLYGEPIVVDGVLYVSRTAVERRTGLEFSAQLVAAGAAEDSAVGAAFGCSHALVAEGLRSRRPHSSLISGLLARRHFQAQGLALPLRPLA